MGSVVYMKPEVDVYVDLDPFVYSTGFAAQTTDYHLVVEMPDGDLREPYFTATPGTPGRPPVFAGDKMKAYVKALPEGATVLEKERVVTPDPVEHCLHIVAGVLRGCFYAVSDLPVLAGKSPVLRGVLSGEDNYRNIVSTRVKYKGNRDSGSRPFYYSKIREYMRGYWDTVVTRNCEADDLISIMAEQSRTQYRDFLVVSVDKDLDQIAGDHYNPDKRVFYRQDRDSALAYFYQQALSGDSTDNIPGCYKMGTQKAAAAINEVIAHYDGIGPAEEKALWNMVEEYYVASCQRPGCPYTAQDAANVALETAQLVYIQKAPNELWMPPGISYGWVPEIS